MDERKWVAAVRMEEEKSERASSWEVLDDAYPLPGMQANEMEKNLQGLLQYFRNLSEHRRKHAQHKKRRCVVAIQATTSGKEFGND